MAVAAAHAHLERARMVLAGGAFAIAAGLLVAGTVSQTLGGILLLGGWLTLVAGLHFFGRAGSARSHLRR